MDKYQGYIRISRLYNTLVGVISLLILLLFVLSIAMPFKETVRLRGNVKDNTIEIKAPKAALVEHLYWKEGDTVNANDTIVKLDMGRSVLYDAENYNEKASLLGERIASVRKEIAILESKRRTELELKALNMEKHSNSIKVLETNVLLQQQILHEQMTILEGVDSLSMKGVLSKKDVTDIKIRVANNKLKVLDLNDRIESRSLNLTVLKKQSDIVIMEIDRQIEASRNELVELEQSVLDLQSVNSLDVKSIESGRVSRIYVEDGDYVKMGDMLATILPNKNSYEVYLRSTSNKIGKIKVNQPVKIWYEAYPKADFGSYNGSVSYVGREPDYTDNKSANTFLVKVTLEKSYVERENIKYNLFAGSAVEVSIRLGEKKILAWLLSSILEHG